MKSNKLNRILLVIPTYNCEKQVIRVLNSFKPEMISRFDQIFVIDNRSEDDTRKVVLNHNLFKSQKIRLFIANYNNNLGGTHKLAFDFGIKNNYTHVAIFHGDDQGDILDLIEMVRILGLSDPKINILGSRFSSGSKLKNYNRLRIVGNLILNTLYSLKTRKVLKDLGSGVNIFSTESLSKFNYNRLNNDLTFNYQLILMLQLHKSPFIYFPITWKEFDQKSNAKIVRVFIKATQILFKFEKTLLPSNEIHSLKMVEVKE
jgi:glycosyltransferase involved in cell wall biosynthesis